jgi:hypothetical protein
MKKLIASASLVVLMCFGFIGLQEVGSTPPEETVVVAPAEETANVTAPAEEAAPAH